MDHFDQGIRQKCQGLEGGPETWLDLDWKKKKKRRAQHPMLALCCHVTKMSQTAQTQRQLFQDKELYKTQTENPQELFMYG